MRRLIRGRTDAPDPTPKDDVTHIDDNTEPTPRPFDPHDTSNCVWNPSCEACDDAPTDKVVTAASDSYVACIALCRACINDGRLPSNLNWMMMLGRAGHHAKHLGVKSPALVAALMTSRRGEPLNDPGNVPVGPYDSSPGVLHWVLTGGYETTTVDPDLTEAWLRAALDEAQVKVGSAEFEAVRAVAALGPVITEVVAGWVRRADIQQVVTTKNFDPAALTRAQQEPITAEAAEERRLMLRRQTGQATA